MLHKKKLKCQTTRKLLGFRNPYLRTFYIMVKKHKKKIKKEEELVVKPAPLINKKDLDSFYAWEGETLILNILGTPNAKKDAIGKVKGKQLKISVKEIPQNGKATDYMIRFLAKEFDVSINDIQLVSGRFNVNKQLRIKNPKKLPSEILREVH